MHVLRRKPTTDKLHALMVDQVAVPVGLHVPPGGDLDDGYLILRPLWGIPIEPDQGFGAARDRDETWTYQVDIYARVGDQLEVLRDVVRELLLGKTETGAWLHDLDTASAKIYGRAASDDAGADVPTAGVFPASARFRLWATAPTS